MLFTVLKVATATPLIAVAVAADLVAQAQRELARLRVASVERAMTSASLSVGQQHFVQRAAAGAARPLAVLAVIQQQTQTQVQPAQHRVQLQRTQVQVAVVTSLVLT